MEKWYKGWKTYFGFGAAAVVALAGILGVPIDAELVTGLTILFGAFGFLGLGHKVQENTDKIS